RIVFWYVDTICRSACCVASRRVVAPKRLVLIDDDRSSAMTRSGERGIGESEANAPFAQKPGFQGPPPAPGLPPVPAPPAAPPPLPGNPPSLGGRSSTTVCRHAGATSSSSATRAREPSQGSPLLIANRRARPGGAGAGPRRRGSGRSA